jgi:hypothetical protein
VSGARIERRRTRIMTVCGQIRAVDHSTFSFSLPGGSEIAIHSAGDQAPVGTGGAVLARPSDAGDSSSGCGSHPDHAATRTGFRSGASVSRTACSHRSLNASACRLTTDSQGVIATLSTPSR